MVIKKVNIYNKKLNTSGHKTELRRIYYCILSELSANSCEFSIRNQTLFQKLYLLRRSKSKYIKTKYIPMPFSPTNYLLKDKSIFYHTISKNKNHLSYKPGYFPRYFYLNKTGYSGWAKHNKPSKEYINFVKEDIENIINSNKYPVKNTTKIKDKNNYILILLQTENDSVQNLHPYSFSRLLDYWKEYSIKNNIKYFIKKHPRAKYSENLFKQHKDALLPYEIDLFSAIDSSKFCVTHNSGSGLQAILRGKKVIIHSETDYKDLAIDNRKYLSFNRISSTLENFKNPSNIEIAKLLASIHFCVDYPKETRNFLSKWIKS
tara:strand:- start:391 stop:1347 length:957 start_codon:yes stop_codon:yes gene_type:complete